MIKMRNKDEDFVDLKDCRRKKVGYFNDIKFVEDNFDFDEDNDLIAAMFGVKEVNDE